MKTFFYNAISIALSYHSFAFLFVEYDFRMWSYEARLTFIIVNFIWWVIVTYIRSNEYD